jgi:hypothetical protein
MWGINGLKKVTIIYECILGSLAVVGIGSDGECRSGGGYATTSTQHQQPWLAWWTLLWWSIVGAPMVHPKDSTLDLNNSDIHTLPFYCTTNVGGHLGLRLSTSPQTSAASSRLHRAGPFFPHALTPIYQDPLLPLASNWYTPSWYSSFHYIVPPPTPLRLSGFRDTHTVHLH